MSEKKVELNEVALENVTGGLTIDCAKKRIGKNGCPLEYYYDDEAQVRSFLSNLNVSGMSEAVAEEASLNGLINAGLIFKK